MIELVENEMEKKELSDIIIFGGSLEELNSIDSKKQYAIANFQVRSSTYVVGNIDSGSPTPEYGRLDASVLDFRKVLKLNGFDGIVRKETKTFLSEKTTYAYYEGIPIVRKKENDDEVRCL